MQHDSYVTATLSICTRYYCDVHVIDINRGSSMLSSLSYDTYKSIAPSQSNRIGRSGIYSYSICSIYLWGVSSSQTLVFSLSAITRTHWYPSGEFETRILLTSKCGISSTSRFLTYLYCSIERAYWICSYHGSKRIVYDYCCWCISHVHHSNTWYK